MTSLSGYRTSFFICCSLFFLLIVSVFRGLVGTDTYAYEVIMERLSDGFSLAGMEPGFVFVSWLLLQVVDSASLTVRLIGCLIFCALFLYSYRSDKNEKILLVSYILPSFIYQYTMNGLRVGMAATLLLLATQQVRRIKTTSAYALAAASLTFHYSALVSLILIWASKVYWIKTSNILVVPVAILSTLVFFYANEYYFSHKLISYQNFDSPNSFSGVGKILTLLVIFFGVLVSNLLTADKAKLLFLGVGSMLVFWIISMFSYAGLRFLDLLSFSFPLCVLTAYSNRGLEFGKLVGLSFFIAGLIAAVMSYRNFLYEEGAGPSPFLPYYLNGL
ncbi:EpsG family protein [Pseudomonas sp. MAFF 311095]|uniref:EpsG family protein n=2 Tax=Pseudomonas petroselini TaxID=2899822 RepID=A0ABS8QY01_9PSED|nr:EpsG family protein [Pseudomonas petroselini]MCD7040372.1 EpsG family protein [Pseudomonas petroselini]MCD7045591.1 EpsG family protein [Pseudomonas petroselini]MCD7069012.1 EpsG family protein [Pseudomonas petroselini]MCD7079639.1 EpsG family protein [Pseudomonas petroselini]